MPADAASAVGKSSINDRSPSGRLVGSEGKRVRIRQYARLVDDALMPTTSISNSPHWSTNAAGNGAPPPPWPISRGRQPSEQWPR